MPSSPNLHRACTNVSFSISFQRIDGVVPIGIANVEIIFVIDRIVMSGKGIECADHCSSCFRANKKSGKKETRSRVRACGT